MSTLVVKVGVALGTVAAVTSFLPMLKLLMGECFFEQGCGEHEGARLVGVALTSCLVGFVVALGTVRLVRMMASSEQQSR
jgi:hypothetical protein